MREICLQLHLKCSAVYARHVNFEQKSVRLDKSWQQVKEYNVHVKNPCKLCHMLSI